MKAAEIMTVEEVARELGLSARRVRQFCNEGRIGTRRGWQWLITRDELESFKRQYRPCGRPKGS
jgi:excisionase family DNA binding protein